jgi:hypothetical protein
MAATGLARDDFVRIISLYLVAAGKLVGVATLGNLATFPYLVRVQTSHLTENVRRPLKSNTLRPNTQNSIGDPDLQGEDGAGIGLLAI